MKKVAIILSIIFLLIIIVLYFNFKTVELKYIGKGYIINPEAPYLDKDIFFLQIPGRVFNEEVCKRLNWFKSQQRKTDCEIKWDDNITFDNNKLYFIGVGCKINKITYPYHSRFFISMNSYPSEVTYFSDSHEYLEPEDKMNVINVYENNEKLLLIP